MWKASSRDLVLFLLHLSFAHFNVEGIIEGFGIVFFSEILGICSMNNTIKMVRQVKISVYVL